MKVWSNDSFLRAGQAEEPRSLDAFGDCTAPSETSSKFSWLQVLWLGGLRIGWCRELMNPPGWELIRAQFFNYGTLSEPLPGPPQHPSMDTLHLSVFLYFLIIWWYDSNYLSLGREIVTELLFASWNPAFLWRWLHLINVLHSRCASPTPTGGWCGNRKTLACDASLLWLKRHL